MKIRCTRAVLFSCVLLASSMASAAQSPLQAPTWPQAFSLAAGDRATFAIPNPGAGSVKITVTWSGNPLTISVAGSNDKVLIPPAAKSVPSFSFTIDAATAGQPSACPLIVLALELKATGAAAKAAGNVSVDSPAVDMARLQEHAKPLMAQASTRTPALTQQQSAAMLQAAKSAEEAKNKAAEAQKAAQAKSLISQASSEIAAQQKLLKNMASPGKGPKIAPRSLTAGPQAKLGGTSQAAQSTTSTVSPILRSVSPERGLCGEQVTLTGVGLTSDATEVHFTIAPNTVVQANILAFTKAADGTVTMRVQVPEKAGLTSPFAGQVVVKATDRNPVVTTNALPFHFTPIVTPSIVLIQPVAVVSGDSVELQGNNFAAGDIVHFVIPGIGDVACETTTVQSTTRMTARVQAYTSREILNGSAYIVHKTPTGWVCSQNAPMLFNPSVPLIQSVPEAAEAENPILIRGVSFGRDAAQLSGQASGVSAASAGGAGGSASGAVYLVDASGKEYRMEPLSWTDTRITARTPAITGFVNPQNCTVYVKTAGGKSDPKPMKLTPACTTTLMLLGDIVANNDYVFTKKSNPDSFSLVPSAAAGFFLNGYHYAGWLLGHSGDDLYFLNRKLRNGWVVESIDFTQENARLVESRIGTDSPYMKIHWWCDAPLKTATYTVKIYVRGPKGTMY